MAEQTSSIKSEDGVVTTEEDLPNQSSISPPTPVQSNKYSGLIDKVYYTDHGNLIGDINLPHKFFLRDRLVRSTVGKPYIFGYNISQGEAEPNRSLVGGAEAENKSVNSIWADLLRSHGPGSEVLWAYTLLLLTKLNEVGDVATMVWKHMRGLKSDLKDRRPFYYLASQSVSVLCGNVSRSSFLIF